MTQPISGIALALSRMYTLAGNTILGFPVPNANLSPVSIAAPPPAPAAIASDGIGNLYTLNEADTVYVYPPGATTASGSLTVQIDRGVPVALTIDQSGYLYAASDGTVQVYAPGSTGTAAPLRAISGSATGLRSIVGLAVDAKGYLYVADTQLNGIAVFAPGATGNVQPFSTLFGPSTSINSPSAIAIGP